MSNLHSTGLGRTLTVAFGAVLLTMALTLPVAFISFAKINDSAKNAADSVLILDQVRKLQGDIGLIRVHAHDYSHTPTAHNLTNLERSLNKLTKHAQEIKDFEAPREEYMQWTAISTAASDAKVKLAMHGGSAAALRQFDLTVNRKVTNPARGLANRAKVRSQEANAGIKQQIVASTLSLFAVLAIAIALAGAFAFWIPRKLVHRLHKLRTASHQVAEGDLSARVIDTATERDEIGEVIVTFNAMAQRLQENETRNHTLQYQLQMGLRSEQERATRDPLTSLRNHRYFQDTLAAEIDRSARGGREVTIAVIDLDDFKQVNDRFGHHEGDAVLLRVTEGITQMLRPYDLACRLGGEEFGIIFPETSADEAKMVLDRVAQHIAHCGPQGGRATFSGGIATFPIHSETQAELYQRADEASYTAKSRGKNQSIIYDKFEVAPMGSEERKRQQTQDAAMKTARSLVDAIDQKDPYTRHHSERTALYAMSIARGLGLDDENVQLIYRCGLLHDVGKIGISDPILRKAGQLTHDEYQQIKQHSEFSYRILETAQMEPIATWTRHHHEHWDGTGYPSGLKGTEIPLGSRIILVADAFEAMTSDRVYRRALTLQQAVEELVNNAGTQFDPTIVAVTVQLVRDGVFQQIMQQFQQPQNPGLGSLTAAPGTQAPAAHMPPISRPTNLVATDSSQAYAANPDLAAALDSFHFQPFTLNLPYQVEASGHDSGVVGETTDAPLAEEPTDLLKRPKFDDGTGGEQAA